jgi:hypothetical protein
VKRGTPNHPKTHALAHALGVEVWAAAGLLECIWHFTGRYAPRGDIGRWPDERIAADVGWRGDPARLVSILTHSGFLDAHPLYRLVVHDWHDHADETTKKHLKRHKLSFASRSRRVSGHVQDTSGPGPDSPRPTKPSRAVPSLASPGRAVPADQADEPPPTPATPQEARDVAIERLGPRDNPLVDRTVLEPEYLRLVREVAAKEGIDPTEVAGGVGTWKGSRKINPASMSDDRLLNTVLDLRRRLGATDDGTKHGLPTTGPWEKPA